MEEFKDFLDADATNRPFSLKTSFMGDPMAELGFYDANEDLSGWSFKELYDDSQWQEYELTLLGGPQRFRGPFLGMINPRDGCRRSCLKYFRRFWPNNVLDRIVTVTNR